METLTKPIYVGYNVNGKYTKEVTLLNSNGVAEKVYLEKLPEKPYTWMGNCLAVSIGEINGVQIAAKVREQYLRNRSLSIPSIILDMPLADVNSLLLEIHRTIWQNIIPNQEVMCKYCGEKMIVEIDLNKIELPEKDFDNTLLEWDSLTCDLLTGWVFNSPGSQGNKLYEEFDGVHFNRFIFRIPTLRDGIMNEKLMNDSVTLWRRIALSTIICARSVDKDGNILAELPGEAIKTMGIRIFEQQLNGKDLQKIRSCLRETLPTLPYYYEDECVNCHRNTPVSMEATNFFSD